MTRCNMQIGQVAPYASLQATSAPREALPVMRWRAAGSAWRVWRWCVGAVLGLGLASEVGAQIIYTFNFDNPTQTIAENADGAEFTLLRMPYTITASSAPGAPRFDIVFAITYREAVASDLAEVNFSREIGTEAGSRSFRELGGVWTVSSVWAVKVVNDGVAEIDETFVVSVSSVADGFVLGTNPTTTIMITNDDVASIRMLITRGEHNSSLTLNEEQGCIFGLDNWELLLGAAVEEDTTVTAVVPEDAPVCFRNTTGILTITSVDRIGFGGSPISKRTGIARRNDDFALKDRDVTMSFVIEGEPVYEAITLRDVRVRLNDDDTAAVKFYATSDTSEELTVLKTHSFDSMELFEKVFYVALSTPLPAGETVTVALESSDPRKGKFIVPLAAQHDGRTLTFTGAIARQTLTLADVQRNGNADIYHLDVSVSTTNSASKYDGLTVDSLPVSNAQAVRTPTTMVIFYTTPAALMTHAFSSQPNHAVHFYVEPSTQLLDGETVTVTLTISNSEQGEFVVNEAGATATEIILTFTGAIMPQRVTLRGVDNGVFDGMTTGYNIDVAVQTTDTATSAYHGLTVPALMAQNQDAQFVPGGIDDLSATREAAAVALSWTAPYDGNADITGYQYIQVTTSGTYGAAAWTNIPSSDASTTAYVVRGLTNRTTYYFQVRAVNGIGNGADSNEASATPLAPVSFDGATVPEQFYTQATEITGLQLPVASGGTGAYDYTLTSVPSGLAGLGFAAASRTLSGAPDSPPGTAITLIYMAADANDSSVESATLMFTLQVFDRPQFSADVPGHVANGNTFEYVVGTMIDTLTLPQGTTYARRGASQPGRMHALTPPALRTELLIGTQPNGLMFDPASREISGSPTLEGSQIYTWTVTDMNGATASLGFILNINPVTIAVSDDADGYGVAETEKLVSAVDDSDSATWRYKAIDNPTATMCNADVFVIDAVDYTEGDMVILEDQADNGKQLCFESTFGSSFTYASSQTIGGIVDAGVIFYTTEAGRSEDIITAALMTHAFSSQSNHAVHFYVAPSTQLPDSETVTVTLTIDDSEQGEFVVDDVGNTATEIMLTFTGAITPQGVTLRGVDNDVFDGMTTDYNIDVAVQTTAIATSEYHGLIVSALMAQNQDAQFVPGDIDDLSATPEDAAVALSWIEPPYDGNADITGYQYRQATTSRTYGAAAWTNIPSSDASTTAYVVRGLTNRTTYYFQVRAVNGIGNGADSNEASATPLAPVSFDGATVPDQFYTQATEITGLQLPVASGGTGSYDYTLTSVPSGLAGLSFAAASRILSGAPDSSSGTAITLSYMVTDANDRSVESATLMFTLQVFDRPQFSADLPGNVANDETFEYVVGTMIDTLTLPQGMTHAHSGEGDPPPMTQALTPLALPAGLMFAPASREISGSPTLEGSQVYTWTVTDMNGATVSLDFSLNINPVTITVSDDADGYGVAETEKLVSAVDDSDGTTWRYKAIDNPTATMCNAAVFATDAVDYTEGDMVILEDQADNGKQLCFESTFGSSFTYASSQTIGGIVDAGVIFYTTEAGRSEDIITAALMTHAFSSQSNHAVHFYVAPSTQLPDSETVTVTLTIDDSEQGEFVVDDVGNTATEIMLTFTGAITPQGVTLRGVDNDVFDGMTTDYNIDVAVQTTAIATSEYHGLIVSALAAQNQDAQFVPGDIDDLSATPEAVAAVALSWTAPDDGKADIARYQYRQATTSGTYGAAAWTNIPSSDASTTTHTVTGLAPGTYYFQVRAVNAIGNGADSNEASATLLALDLNGDLVADIEDARIVYYAYVPELSCLGAGSAARAPARAAVLDPLADKAADDAARCDLLTVARARLPDLNQDTVSNVEDAAVLYYSYALEGSLGNGDDRQGIAVIKQAILEDLAAGLSVNELLVKVHEFRTQ